MLSLLDYFVSWLQLENKDWLMFVDSEKADYYDILEDFPERSLHELVLKQ